MDELIGILSDIRPDVDFRNEEDLVGRGIIDSFDVVTIIAFIDEKFDVMIPPEYILPKYFYSAKTIYDLITGLKDANI